MMERWMMGDPTVPHHTVSGHIAKPHFCLYYHVHGRGWSVKGSFVPYNDVWGTITQSLRTGGRGGCASSTALALSYWPGGVGCLLPQFLGGPW